VVARYVYISVVYPPFLTWYTVQPRAGVDKGPIHLIEAGILTELEELGWKVKFDGHHQFEEINADIDPPIGILKNPRLVSRVNESVAKVVGEHGSKGELPVTLGGDHSLVSCQGISYAI
jgi:arginase